MIKVLIRRVARGKGKRSAGNGRLTRWANGPEGERQVADKVNMELVDRRKKGERKDVGRRRMCGPVGVFLRHSDVFVRRPPQRGKRGSWRVAVPASNWFAVEPRGGLMG